MIWLVLGKKFLSSSLRVAWSLTTGIIVFPVLLPWALVKSAYAYEVHCYYNRVVAPPRFGVVVGIGLQLTTEVESCRASFYPKSCHYVVPLSILLLDLVNQLPFRMWHCVLLIWAYTRWRALDSAMLCRVLFIGRSMTSRIDYPPINKTGIFGWEQ